MKPFEKFKKVHGKPQKCENISEAEINNYKEKLSDDLLQEWKQNGWCSFGDGLIWTVNPDDYTDILDDWLEKTDKAYAFARTAFGSIFFRNGLDNFFLDVLNQDISKVFHRIDFVFDGTLCDDEYLDDVILRPLFREALNVFGTLENNECYGFFPSPVMGGELVIENVRKVKIREYLAILSEL
jgi:hypothetical protein